MTKVILIKNYRNTVTLKQLELQEIVQAIQDQAYKELFHQLCYVYPLADCIPPVDTQRGEGTVCKHKILRRRKHR